MLETVRKNLAESGDQGDDYIARELMVKIAYEMGFGIFPHDLEVSRPFALMAAHPKEDYLPYSSQYRDYAKYIEADIHAKTGESMTEFFRRPRHEVEMIFSIVRSKRAAETAEMAAITQNLQQPV